MKNKKGLLFIIEAPGKIESLKKALDPVVDDKYKIIATKGRLYDLPKDSLSVDETDYSLLNLQAKDKFIIEQIRESAESSSKVYVMTDSDIEGEVIASHVFTIIRDKSKFFRVDPSFMTSDLVMKSLDNTRPLNMSQVMSGNARRAYDRVMGYMLSSHDWSTKGIPQGVVGRVTTPVLSVLQKAEHEQGVIQRPLFDSKGNEWLLELPVNHVTLEQSAQMTSLIDSLPDVEVEPVGDLEIMDDDTRPWTGPEALLNISYTINKPVNEIANELQNLYEKGEISYPRTDSFYLSKETIEQMGKLAEHFGVDGFDKEHLAEKAKRVSASNDNSQDAHEGIVPLIHRMDYKMPLFSMSTQDQILAILTRNIMRSGQKDRKVAIQKAVIKSGNQSVSWEKALKDWPLGFTITRKTTFIDGYSRLNTINDKLKPLGHPISSLDQGRASLRLYQKDWIVLRAMIDNDIGRPSTMPYHSSKISRKMLAKNGLINGHAQSSLSRASILSPGLLSVEKAIQAEKILHSDLNTSIKDRVLEAMRISGVLVATEVAENVIENTLISNKEINNISELTTYIDLKQDQKEGKENKAKTKEQTKNTNRYDNLDKSNEPSIDL